MFNFLFELRNIILPLFLLFLGLIIILISTSHKLAWRMEWAPEKLMRLLPFGLFTVVFGLGWLVMPGFSSLLNRPATAAASSTQFPPTPLPPPFIIIQEPQQNLNCRKSDNTCWFNMQGTFGGVFPLKDYRIYTFVFPTDPQGPGYYLQDQPASLAPDGSWTQSPSVYGNRNLPAASGQSLTIQAALVSIDATYNGSRLGDLPPNFYLGAVENIEGLIALSEPISLIVK